MLKQYYKKLFGIIWMVMVASSLYCCFSQEIEISINGGSYNSFLEQVGYCKAQSFETRSRNTSSSPSVFQSGKVLFGVGLSHVQFQHSIVSCGKCIQVITIDRFYSFNNELTQWSYQEPNHGNFTVIVFDECTDPICESGFLDFDIYNDKQPVAYGNPIGLSWQFVPCPVEKDDYIEFLICLGYDACLENNREGQTMEELYSQAISDNWVALYPRNFRISITSVRLQGQDLHDNQSWLWITSSSVLLQEMIWKIEWTNQDKSQQSWLLDWTFYFDKITSYGYRGGYIFQTQLQN